MTTTSAAPASPGSPGTATGASRRDRLRAQTMAEIQTVARRQLVTAGPGGISLRAVAREVGLTAPALYRYYPSLEDLVDAVTLDMFDELIAALESARDAMPIDDVVGRLSQISRAFRTFAIGHPHEFQVMFSTPPGGLGQEFTDACQAASSRFGNVFAEQFRDVWVHHPFPVVGDDELAEGLADGIDEYWQWLVSSFAPDIPKGAVVSFLQAWVQIYGTVALEVFGHIGWALRDGEPLFEQVLYDIGKAWDLPKSAVC